MSSRLVLVDSSSWVSHLTGRGGQDPDALDELLRTHRAATNEVVRMEVLTGAIDEAQYAELADTFQGLHVLPLSGAVWKRAERLRFELRRAGRLIPLPDVLVACSALLAGCELLHADRHYEVIARVTPLRIYHAAVR